MTEINYWKLYDATSCKYYWISITDEKSEYGNYFVDSEDVGRYAKDYDEAVDMAFAIIGAHLMAGYEVIHHQVIDEYAQDYKRHFKWRLL